MRILFITLTLMFSFNAVSAPVELSGRIKSINIKETGYIFVTFKSNHANTENCENPDTIAISHNHLAKKEILDVLLSAFKVGRTAYFLVNGCYKNYGTSFSNGITVEIRY